MFRTYFLKTFSDTKIYPRALLLSSSLCRYVIIIFSISRYKTTSLCHHAVCSVPALARVVVAVVRLRRFVSRKTCFRISASTRDPNRSTAPFYVRISCISTRDTIDAVTYTMANRGFTAWPTGPVSILKNFVCISIFFECAIQKSNGLSFFFSAFNRGRRKMKFVSVNVSKSRIR